jgi:hypothetical protein
MKLDKTFLEAVQGPIWNTFDQIAHDACELGCKRNSEFMELVLDANRLSMGAGEKGKAADKLVGVACDEHGYAKVSKFLCKHIKLV